MRAPAGACRTLPIRLPRKSSWALTIFCGAVVRTSSFFALVLVTSSYVRRLFYLK